MSGRCGRAPCLEVRGLARTSIGVPRRTCRRSGWASLQRSSPATRRVARPELRLVIAWAINSLISARAANVAQVYRYLGACAAARDPRSRSIVRRSRTRRTAAARPVVLFTSGGCGLEVAVADSTTDREVVLVHGGGDRSASGPSCRACCSVPTRLKPAFQVGGGRPLVLSRPPWSPARAWSCPTLLVVPCRPRAGGSAAPIITCGLELLCRR